MKEECEHPALLIEYFKNKRGEVEVQICKFCSTFVQTKCLHSSNTWMPIRVSGDPKEETLVCDLCNADGT